jgi:DNA-binding NarL/FixJ family response regulator/predicted negative regulator of RcsB-dependent stress response
VPLLNRDTELDAIRRVLWGARGGSGAALLVEGEPGIGKSSLLAAARAEAEGFHVLAARATELDGELPFGVVRQLLGPVLERGRANDRAVALAGSGALAEPVLGVPAARGRGAQDAATAQHGLYWFTANLASECPLLLLVDDLQWADVGSLRWLLHLAARLDGLPVALVLAARPVGVRSAEEELVDQLGADPSVQVVHPRALPEAAVARLAELALGAVPEDGFVAACHAATGGNPFLLGELLAELVRLAIAPLDANGGQIERLSSREVGRSVRARLRALPRACLELARAVALLGDGAGRPLAAQLAGLEPDIAARAADRLAAASILGPGALLSFAHPLVRESIYAGLGPAERAGGHQRAAAVLAASGAGPERVATQLLVAEPRGDEYTVRTLLAAAGSASARGAPDTAAAHLRRALIEPPPAALEPEVTLRLGLAELDAGNPAAAAERLTRVVGRLPDGRSRAVAAAALGTAQTFTSGAEEAVATLSDAIAGLDDDDREFGLVLETARFSAGFSTLPAWRRLAVADVRFSVGDEPPQTTGEEMGLAMRAIEHALRGTAADAAAAARAALAPGRLHEAGETLANAFILAPSALMFADELEDATRALTEVIELGRRRGSALVFASASHLRALTWWRRGALHEVEADARQALRDVGFHSTSQGAVALVEALLARGDRAGARAAWRAAGLHEEQDYGFSALKRLHARAQLRLAKGRTRAALEDILESGRLHSEWDIRTPAVANWRAEAAVLLALLGRADEARALAGEGLAVARAFGSARAIGIALRAAAAPERGERALELLREAVVVLERSPARLEHAQALLDLGAALRRGGARTAARRPLADAVDAAAACGADAIVARAHDELVAAGAKPRRDPAESRSRLTASELRVARMAAGGMTNREIAQALFVTEKTVENHLGSAYRKLDIRSRSQLERALPAARLAA